MDPKWYNVNKNGQVWSGHSDNHQKMGKMLAGSAIEAIDEYKGSVQFKEYKEPSALDPLTSGYNQYWMRLADLSLEPYEPSPDPVPNPVPVPTPVPSDPSEVSDTELGKVIRFFALEDIRKVDMPRIKGIDSRWWNGVFPPGYDDVKFVGMKISQELQTNLNLAAPHRQFMTMQDQGRARLPFHYWRGEYNTNLGPDEHGKKQAEFFFEETKKLNKGMGELPPAIDCESRWESPGINALRDICATCKRTEELWGRKPLIYTATWWWNVWVAPYDNFNPALYNPYQYMLWEADPPPDTPEPGDWTKSDIAVVQEVLDWNAPGFNAGIDIDWANEVWYNNEIGTPPPQPGPGPGPVEIEVIVPQGVTVKVTEV